MLAALASTKLELLHSWRALLWTLFAALSIGPLLIGVLKRYTAAHCPWDLARYGGYADYMHEWFAQTAAESGRCLPNAHAGAGFALLALYFAGWASGRPLWRWSGLALGIAAGGSFSLVRSAQGTGPECPGRFRRLDDARCEAILDRTRRVEGFVLDVDGHALGCQVVEPRRGGMADRLQDAFVARHMEILAIAGGA